MSGQDTPNVARAGWIMVASLSLSRVLGLVRDAVIAGTFGQGPEREAYVLSFQIPDLLFFLVAGGALSSAFIPVFSEYLHTGRERDAWRVFSVVVTTMSLLVVAFILLAWAFAPQLVAVVAPGKPELWPLVATLSRIVLPAQFAFFIGGIMFGTLYARQVFAVPGLGPNVYNLGIITGGLVLTQLFHPSVLGLSWGATVGAFIGNLLIPALVIRRLGVDFRPSLDLGHPGVRKVFRLMLPVVLGLSLPGVYALILQYFGSFYGAGVNAALDNANRLMQAPLGVFGQSFAIAAFPALAQFLAQGRVDAFRDQLAGTLRTVVYLTVPVTALFLAMPGGIVRLFLEHGAFTPADTSRTAPILQAFALGIAAWCCHPVLMRAFFALQKTVAPIALGSLATAAFLAICLAARAFTGEPYGLALAGSAAAILLVAMLLAAIRRESAGLDTGGILRTLALSSLSALPMGATAWLVQRFFVDPNPGKVPAAVGVVGGGLLATWAYIFATRALKMPETAAIDRALRRLDRRPPGA